MKRSLVGALLGMAVATSALAQGHILVSNYVDPYNQIYWDPAPGAAPVGRGNTAVVSADALTFQVFYAYGNVVDPAAVNIPGLTFTINDLFNWDPGAGHGAGGYFVNVDQMFDTWSAGQTVTLKYAVVSAGYTGESALWTESANIVIPAASPNSVTATPSLMVSVPEPSTFAMLGLGAAALLIFRRRS